MQVFRFMLDDDLVRSIAGATRGLVFVAPGVFAAVAKGLERCLARHPCPQIMIVLDADEETCRLGYCDAPSLEALSIAATKLGITVRQQRGIRIGLLMADDEILVWTPTPQMFEAPRGANEPNGLLFTQETLQRLPEALGVDPEHPEAKAEIGTEPLKHEEVAKVVAAIKAAPPAPFDLSRLSRVFSSKFQFIETVLRGAELTKREMRLDSRLLGRANIGPIDLRAYRTIRERVLREERLSFLGEPLRGLQVMGALETPSVDHERILFVGANEGTLWPRTDAPASWIPFDLRKHHRLPLPADAGAVTAYNFQRAMQCATHVEWTTSVGDGMESNEPSRFITQWRHEVIGHS